MEVIIEIPKGEYDKICKTMLHTSSGNPNFYFESKIANGTPIPDNATNGDVMKIVFPKIGVYDEWYDEPYQKGGKEWLGYIVTIVRNGIIQEFVQ